MAVEENRHSNATNFGPALRFDTTVLPESTYGKTGGAVKALDAAADVEASAGRNASALIETGAGPKEKDQFYKVSYNWVPAPLVAGAILQSEDPMAELEAGPVLEAPSKMARTATQDLMRRPMQTGSRRRIRK